MKTLSKEITQLFSYLENGTSAFHVVNHSKQVLVDAGFVELKLKDTIMIGDSFIQMFPSDNWALSLKNKLGLSDNQVHIFGEGGAGMFNPRKRWS